MVDNPSYLEYTVNCACIQTLCIALQGCVANLSMVMATDLKEESQLSNFVKVLEADYCKIMLRNHSHNTQVFEHKRNWLYNPLHSIPTAHLEYVHSPSCNRLTLRWSSTMIVVDWLQCNLQMHCLSEGLKWTMICLTNNILCTWSASIPTTIVWQHD